MLCGLISGIWGILKGGLGGCWRYGAVGILGISDSTPLSEDSLPPWPSGSRTSLELDSYMESLRDDRGSRTGRPGRTF